jgi:hypothetical protein
MRMEPYRRQRENTPGAMMRLDEDGDAIKGGDGPPAS